MAGTSYPRRPWCLPGGTGCFECWGQWTQQLRWERKVALLLLCAAAATLPLLADSARQPRWGAGLHLRARGQGGAEGHSIYSVVVDAGSTGSRVHVFRFDAHSRRLLDIGGTPEVFRSTRPGLSACVGNRSRLRSLLDPLLQVAAEAVPEAEQPVTRLALRATAGLRMLPDGAARELLREARDILKGYRFKDAGVEVMSGSEEGLFQWLAVNWLAGALAPQHCVPAAVLDLGGGSVQLAYAVAPAAVLATSAPRRAAYLRDHHLPGQCNVTLYQHSYLGYGILAARDRMLEEAKALGVADSNPCVLQGAGHAGSCSQLLKRLFWHEAACGEGQEAHEGCSFAGAWAGPGWGGGARVTACSSFFDGLVDAGVVPAGLREVSATPATYATLAEKACALTPQEAPAAYPARTAEAALWMCFDLSYLTTILTAGFGLSEEQDFLAAKEISSEGGRGYSATWALGVALDGLMGIGNELQGVGRATNSGR